MAARRNDACAAERLPREDEDFRLIIDRALSHLYRTGAILKLFERHFGQPDASVKLFYLMSALPE